MAGGGKTSSAPTQQTVTQTNIPDWLQGPTQSAVARAEAVSYRPYEAYTGPRIAGFNQDQSASFDMARGLGATYQPLFQQGTGSTQQAQQGFQQAGQYTPGTFQADQVGADTWNTGIAQNYMNPYLDTVLRRQESLQTDRFARDQRNRDLQRAAGGSFGGYRHGVADSVARSEFNRSLDDTAAQALSSAYDRAYQGFSGDRDALIRTGIANQGANLEALRMGEQSRQYGANLGLQSAQGLAGIGDQLFRQGSLARDYAGRDLDVLRGIGQQQQDQAQRNLDLAYTDFTNQRDYERNNIAYLNSIIRGVPYSSSSDVTTYNTENQYSNLLGAGIGATGLINALKTAGG